jgi:hypothetical protein
VNVPEAESDQRPSRSRQTVHGNEQDQTQGKLLARKEHGAYHHVGRRHVAFSHSQDEPESEDAPKVLRGRAAHEEPSPDPNHDACVLGNGQTLKQHTSRNVPDDVAVGEGRCNSRVLLTLQPEIGNQGVGSSIVQGELVQELEDEGSHELGHIKSVSKHSR